MGDRKYCLYLHTSLSGIPFYVGSGTLVRAYRKEGSDARPNSSFRGFAYSLMVAELDFMYDVVILNSGLTKAQAVELEIDYYNKFKDSLTNNRTPVRIIQLDREHLGEFLYYDEGSVTCLKWKVDRFCGRGRLSYSAGDDAGSLSTSGYRVCVNRTEYYVSRIVMELHGVWTTGIIVDHIDGNKLNNKISNLRPVSYSENSRNRRKAINNTSGETGVVFSKNKGGSSYFVSQWQEDGQTFRYYFSIGDFGHDGAFNLAVQHRKDQIERLNNLGYGYSEDHGVRD